MDVKVFSSPSCMKCKQLKNYLRSKSIRFNDINVTQNQDNWDLMLNTSGQIGVPVLDVNGTVMVGFNKDAIDGLLKIF